MYKSIDQLTKKYENNEYMTKKLYEHITQNLEPLMDSIEQNFNERQVRKTDMTDTMITFYSEFIKKHNLFYCSYSELFFNYDGEHYTIYNEDDIIHDILSSITRDSKLFPWKFKVKINVIKQIKDRNIFNNIPESYTIQHVIKNLYPILFPSKNWAKYFLTILGDILLKKRETLIYFMTYENKNIIKYIHNECNSCAGVNIHTYFKFKYYDHIPENCRLINCNNIRDELNAFLKKYTMDLLCVATHYSTRYGSSEEFLNEVKDKKLKNHALHLKQNSTDSIMNDFLTNCIIKKTGSKINSKNIIFIWKKFLEQKNFPKIIFHQNLLNRLITKLEYDDKSCNFLNITSVYLPVMSVFLDFWNQHMFESENEIEYELQEILVLIHDNTNSRQMDELDDILLLEMIKYYYPNVALEENKYILQYGCKLWDKTSDILTALDEYKKLSENKYDAYQYYCKYFSKKKYIVSKRYFEKFVSTYK